MSTWLAKDSKWRHWLVIGFLGGLLVLGLVILRDFGLSYDARQSRVIGMTSLRYVAEKLDPAFLEDSTQQAAFKIYDTPLQWFGDRDYGVAYELPVTLAERVLRLSDTRSQFLFRHLCTFLVSWVGVLALYGLGKRRYDDWRAGLLVAFLLVLSPRLFGEFFYNDKDAVFMALSTVATYTTVRFLERPTWRWGLLHALACAVAIDVRLMAVLWPVATLALLAWRAGFGEYRSVKWLHIAGALGVYAVVLPAVVVLLWPFLWEAPWTNFNYAFSSMQHFRWGGDVLYRGHMVNAGDLPWHYIFKWVGITTPILQLALILLGLVLVRRQLTHRDWRLYAANTREWQDLLFAGLGIGPVVAVIIFHSVLYDGWRQMYFIYPSLLLLALRGIMSTASWLRNRPRWQGGIVAALLAVGLLSSARQIIWMHPFEGLYFSALGGSHASDRYEHDYWGTAYTAGLRWVLAHDSRPVIKIATNDRMQNPMQGNYELLPPELRKRIELVWSPDGADYFLANYRWHPQDYDMPNKVHEVMAGNQRAMTIFKLTQ
ncbi:MAG: glycosyltransferase family 39 protein [Janthinobacterium lividum]